ncbi:MAG: nitroreductase [Bermanella sp.]
MNPVIDLIKNRVSCPKLTLPGPSESEIEQIFACALRAPDHGRIRPWRFHVVAGDARESLGQVFANVAQESGDCIDAKVEKCRNMPLRSPLMVVAVCEPQQNNKVPEIEQILAVGAAVQNMQIAISSLGYASVWRTGEMAAAKLVKTAFDVSEQGSIVAFLYIGTAEKAPNKPELEISSYVSRWKP